MGNQAGDSDGLELHDANLQEPLVGEQTTWDRRILEDAVFGKVDLLRVLAMSSVILGQWGMAFDHFSKAWLLALLLLARDMSSYRWVVCLFYLETQVGSGELCSAQSDICNSRG